MSKQPHGRWRRNQLKAPLCASDGSGFVTTVDNDYNVSSEPSGACGITGSGSDRTGLSQPLVGPLQDNGGPTKTMAPTATNPAIDRMPVAACSVTTVASDQRGYPRPDSPGGNCDSGAYEQFTCNGSILNAPGAFSGCPPPSTGGGGGAGSASPTGERAAALKRCKKKHGRARKKCKKKANLLPV